MTTVPLDTPAALVALVGRPNVGKSTLFNRLTRSRRAIVDPAPGVTRDRHYERVTWRDRTFILIDTGGIDRDKSEPLAGRIREQSLQAIAEAEAICFLLDGREGLTRTDHEIVALLRKSEKQVYYLVNKIDAPDQESRLLPSFYELGIEELWPISAEHGYGVSSLLDELVRRLPPGPPPPELPAETIRLACLGRPNVGKSSLINRLIGEERMLVSSLPGTTRDSVDTLLDRGDRQYLFIDTAGIRRKGKVREKLEKFSVIRALAALERCDTALAVLDAGEGITEQDAKVIGYSQEQGRACILLLNKWDLLKGDGKRQRQLLEETRRATPFVGFAPVLTTSALTGAGTGKILPTVHRVHHQYRLSFATSRLNRLLQEAVADHPPPMHRGRRLKFYYTTQLGTAPPSFAVVTNYPEGVHFSYHRFLVNRFREGLGLDLVPLRVFFRQRQRRRRKGK